MFTVQQIQEISRKLSSMGLRDSDFKSLDSWTSIDGKDFISFIKDGINRKMTVEQFYTYLRQNINGDIGNALERISKIENNITDINSTLVSLNRSINSINDTLHILTLKYVITVLPTTPNSTVFINGIEQTSLEVTAGSAVSIKIESPGYITYNELILVDKNMTLSPELELDEVIFTINTDPLDSKVLLNGIERNSITVPRGSSVNWTVSKSGYITKSSSEIVDFSHNLPVTLYQTEPDKVNFSINVETPSSTIVTINGEQRNSIIINKGDSVTWSVESPHYITQNGTNVIEEDTSLSISLEAEKYTLTVSAIPEDSIIKINDIIGNSITVDYLTKVQISVSKVGYISYKEEYTVLQTETKEIELLPIEVIGYTNFGIEVSDTSEHTLNEVPSLGGNISMKAYITEHYNNDTSERKDVTSETSWTAIGTGFTSNNDGSFTWSMNNSEIIRTATIAAQYTSPELEQFIRSTETSQLGLKKFEATPISIEFGNSGGTQEINISSDFEWKIN